MSAAPQRTVGVIGGGTAGYFAALAIQRRFPHFAVTLVESAEVPIIGVGEATTTLLPPFLHRELGLDVVALFRAVRPTFKLGIHFEWGGLGTFDYPFGESHLIDAHALDGSTRSRSFTARLMEANALPMVRDTDGAIRSLLPATKLAYHLDNAPFVAFLRAAAAARGIVRVEATMRGAERNTNSGDVAAVVTATGERLVFDDYVDATGFRSLLLEGALGASFVSYASSLFCDRAVVASVPRRGPMEPFTTAETMDAGWCWRIPMGGDDHRGYVHASAFLSEDEALAELRAKNPGAGEPRTVRFRSGRHDRAWIGNTFALGNAYAFVEPLESTGLHMIIVAIGYLLAGLATRERGGDIEAERAGTNDALATHWDFLRWFLAVHYRFNGRLETPFWRAARSTADVSGLDELLARYATEGPFAKVDGLRTRPGDAVFGYGDIMTLLLGQGVPAGPGRLAIAPEIIRARDADAAALASRALACDEGWTRLLDAEALLRDFAEGPASWVTADRDRRRPPRYGS